MALNPLQQAMADGEVESQRFSVSSVAEDINEQLAGGDEEPAEERADEGESEEGPVEERAEAQAEEEQGEEPAEQATVEEEDIDSFDGLAKQLELESPEDFADLKWKLGEGEETEEVALREIIDGYQTGKKAVQEHQQQLTQVNQGYQTAIKGVTDQYQTAIHGAHAAFEKAKENLKTIMQASDMATLRHENPQEWAARQVEFQQVDAALNQAYHEATKQHTETMNAVKQNYIANEIQKLQAEPEGWSQEKFNTAMSVMTSTGFTPEEAINLFDARLVKLALELNTLRGENTGFKKEKEAGKKAVKSVKRTVPKGQLRPARDKRTGKFTAIKGSKGKVISLQKRLAKTGSVQDAGKAIAAQLWED